MSLKTPAAPTLRAGDVLAFVLAWMASLRRAKLHDTSGSAYDEFYEGFFDDKDLEAAEADARKRVRHESVVEYLQHSSPPPRTVVDVGCGMGGLLRMMPGGFELSGVEYSTATIRRAAALLGDRATLHRASLSDLPFASDSQDAAVCLEVLEHIEDDEAAVAELFRILRPGGVLIASVPYAYYWRAYRRWIGHFRHYTSESFSSLLSNAGFVVESYLPNTPRWHAKFARRYFIARAAAMTIGRVTGESSPYRFRWPWAREPFLERMRRRLEPSRLRESRVDCRVLDTSTFIAARKPPVRS